ncbi:hypothetical protein [Paenibacillus thiaminolyticus]|uniref:Uncharacterized protein n=1 Tax=Paenibacillus thiaminolyticus TaxID=49283 RepID=A0A3A3GBT6_PANTH|nr:hypothetical protein [Paenibacillus thiaminolyticus]RJG20426.1 hypothetical protein DQX05_25165 [Paenibacillus thiaminolyticus]
MARQGWLTAGRRTIGGITPASGSSSGGSGSHRRPEERGFRMEGFVRSGSRGDAGTICGQEGRL